MKEVNAPNCGRDNELIAFLYDELSDDESRTFRQHVHDCPACSRELASFQQVRESVVAWRDESLGGVLLPGQIADSSPLRFTQEKPSALAAVREFFNLAPVWMKGAVAVASILLCLFAGLAIARLREAPSKVIVADHNSSMEEQINAQVQRRVQEEVDRRVREGVDQRVREEIERIKKSMAPKPEASMAANNDGIPHSWRQTTQVNTPTQKARRPLSKTEREQLAADLRLVSARNENELDLLDEGINQ